MLTFFFFNFFFSFVFFHSFTYPASHCILIHRLVIIPFSPPHLSERLELLQTTIVMQEESQSQFNAHFLQEKNRSKLISDQLSSTLNEKAEMGREILHLKGEISTLSTDWRILKIKYEKVRKNHLRKKVEFERAHSDMSMAWRNLKIEHEKLRKEKAELEGANAKLSTAWRILKVVYEKQRTNNQKEKADHERENSKLSTELSNLNAEYQQEKAMRAKLEAMVDQVDQKFKDVICVSKWYKQRVKTLEERLLLD